VEISERERKLQEAVRRLDLEVQRMNRLLPKKMPACAVDPRRRMIFWERWKVAG